MRRLLVSSLVLLALFAASWSDGQSAPSAGGTTIDVTDTTWTCSKAIASYGPTPLTVNARYTKNYAGQAIRLGPGCVGDGTPATDLIVHVKGNGLTFGPQDDALRVMNSRPGASNLEVEGTLNCGSQKGTAFHQDGIQVLGGTNITFRNMSSGDYDAGHATCQGAGGIFFLSEPSQNVDLIDSKFIGCNHALLAGANNGSGSTITGNSFRTGYAPGDPVCDGYYVSDPCVIENGWGGEASNNICDRYPFETPPPPPPPPPTPPAPPAPPCGALGVPSIC